MSNADPTGILGAVSGFLQVDYCEEMAKKVLQKPKTFPTLSFPWRKKY